MAHGLVDLFQVGDGHHIAGYMSQRFRRVIGLEDHVQTVPVGDTGQMIQEGRTVQSMAFFGKSA